MTKKRLIVLMSLVLSMVLILSACGSSNQAGQEPKTPNENVKTGEKVETDEKVVKFKFVSSKQDEMLTEALKFMAKSMEEKSGGTLQPETYLEGQIGNNDEDLASGLIEKNYELLINGDWFASWHSPEWVNLLNVGFVLRDADHLYKFWNSDIGQMLNEKTLKEYDVKAYTKTIGLRGARYLTANKPIKHVDDMKGLKMRTPNNAGVVASWNATGSNVTPVPWGELYGALQSGIVDAQENPAANIDSGGLYQVQKYLMQTGHQYIAFIAHMDNTWFESLSEKQQKAITDSIDEGFAIYNKKVVEDEGKLFEKFKEKGMTIIPKEEIDIESFKQKITPVVLEELKDKLPEGGYDKLQTIK
ncbi:MAG: TRAP transporter substrate-binding protein [Clostridia bacterium]